METNGFKSEAPVYVDKVTPDMTQYKSRFVGASKPGGGVDVTVSAKTLERAEQLIKSGAEKLDAREHPKAAPDGKTEAKPEVKADAKPTIKLGDKPEVKPVTPKAAPEAAPAKEDRPTWLPEKFKTPEDMAKAYSELETKLSKGEPKTAEPEAKTEPVKEVKQAKAKTEAPKTVDFTEYYTELTSKGALSDDSYGKLEAQGYPKDLVNAYIAGQQALQKAEVARLYSAAEGQDSFNKMIEWANSNFSDKDIEAINSSINDSNTDKAEQAIKGLYAQFKQHTKEYKPLKGDSAAPSLVGYSSKTEWLNAIKDPRYSKDSTYRNQVAMKRSISTF